MSIAFVLGNGVSRKQVPLHDLKQIGTVYGCNALYREFEPDVLVATDMPIATMIQESGYAIKHAFYTRKPKPNLGGRRVPQDYYGYSSGPIAAALAAQSGARRLYLIGFDLGPLENNRFNNVYAGTEFYKGTDSLPTFTGNWIKQICRIMQDFPGQEFVRVMGKTTSTVREFDQHKNFRHLDLDTFLHRINKVEDL